MNIEPGDKVRCVHHTKFRDREGAIRTIEKVGKSYWNCEDNYRINLPKRKRDIRIDTDSVLGYWLDDLKGNQNWAYIEYWKEDA